MRISTLDLSIDDLERFEAQARQAIGTRDL